MIFDIAEILFRLAILKVNVWLWGLSDFIYIFTLFFVGENNQVSLAGEYLIMATKELNTKMASALRSKILASKPQKLEPAAIPEWDAVIYIKEMSLGERDAFEAEQVRRNEDGTVRLETIGLKARLVVLTACDESGDRIFSDEDAEGLAETSSVGVERAFAIAQRVNRMRKADVAELSNADSFTSGLNGASASV